MTIEIRVTKYKAVLTATHKGKNIMKEVQHHCLEVANDKAVLQNLSIALEAIKVDNQPIVVTLVGNDLVSTLTYSTTYLEESLKNNFQTEDGIELYLSSYWREVFSTQKAKDLVYKGLLTFNFVSTFHMLVH